MSILKNFLIKFSFLVLPISMVCGQSWIMVTDFEIGNFAEINQSFSMSGAGGPLDNDNGIPPLIGLWPGPEDDTNTVYYGDGLAYGIWWNAFHTYIPFPPAAQIADGAQGTMYFRIYFDGGTGTSVDTGFTATPFSAYDPPTIDDYKSVDDELLSLMATPNVWGDTETQAGLSDIVRFKDGAGFVASSLPANPANEWIDVWIYADNATDTWELYLRHSGTDGIEKALVVPAEGEPYAPYGFQRGTDQPLIGWFLGTSAGNPGAPPAGDPKYIDDIYVWVGEGAKLETPSTAPALPRSGPHKVTDFEIANFAEINQSFSMSGAGGPLDNDNGIPPLIGLWPGPVDAENTVYYGDGLAYGIWWNAFHTYIPFPPEAMIPNGSQGTMYFRMYFDGGTGTSVDTGFTATPFTPYDPPTIDDYKSIDDELLSLMATPNVWGDTETQAGLSDIVRFKDGAGFVASSLPANPANEWIDVWIYADNATDTWELYLRHSGTDGIEKALVVPAEGEPYAPYGFQRGTDQPLSGWFLGTSAGNPGAPPAGDPKYIDDIYVWTGAGAVLEDPTVAKTKVGPYDIQNGWIDTGDHMGWLAYTGSAWFYSLSLNGWVYIPNADTTLADASGAWAYVAK